MMISLSDAITSTPMTSKKKPIDIAIFPFNENPSIHNISSDGQIFIKPTTNINMTTVSTDEEFREELIAFNNVQPSEYLTTSTSLNQCSKICSNRSELNSDHSSIPCFPKPVKISLPAAIVNISSTIFNDRFSSTKKKDKSLTKLSVDHTNSIDENTSTARRTLNFDFVGTRRCERFKNQNSDIVIPVRPMNHFSNLFSNTSANYNDSINNSILKVNNDIKKDSLNQSATNVQSSSTFISSPRPNFVSRRRIVRFKEIDSIDKPVSDSPENSSMLCNQHIPSTLSNTSITPIGGALTQIAESPLKSNTEFVDVRKSVDQNSNNNSPSMTASILAMDNNNKTPHRFTMLLKNGKWKRSILNQRKSSE